MIEAARLAASIVQSFSCDGGEGPLSGSRRRPHFDVEFPPHRARRVLDLVEARVVVEIEQAINLRRMNVESTPP